MMATVPRIETVVNGVTLTTAATSYLVCPENAQRRALILSNPGSYAIYFRFGTAPSSAAQEGNVAVPSNASLVISPAPQAAIYAIAVSAAQKATAVEIM